MTTAAVGNAYGGAAITLQQLSYFLAAAEHGSFTAAAESLHLARPSLSEQIARLEAELGLPLFVRAGRGLELTDVGRLLRPEAERTLAAAQETADAARRARTLAGGMASFGMFGTAHHFQRVLLVDLVEDFSRRHPQVRVRVLGLNSSEVADSVRDGRLEAGLVEVPVDDEGLDVGAPVAALETMYISVHPDRLRRPLTIEEVARARLILPEAHWGNTDPIRRQLAERAQRAGIRIRPHIEVEHGSAALELAARGVGDTVMTRAMVEAQGLADRLGCVSLDPPLYEVYAFITRRPATRAFMDLATSHLSALRTPAANELPG